MSNITRFRKVGLPSFIENDSKGHAVDSQNTMFHVEIDKLVPLLARSPTRVCRDAYTVAKFRHQLLVMMVHLELIWPGGS